MSDYLSGRAEGIMADLYRAKVQRAEETRALLIEMRQYVLYHGVLIGECVAWTRLKETYGVGEDQQADEVWLAEYRAGKEVPS